MQLLFIVHGDSVYQIATSWIPIHVSTNLAYGLEINKSLLDIAM